MATALKTFTYADIMALEPCYDPAARGCCTRDWTGTALDVLRMDHVPAGDRLWLVLQDGWLPDRILHEFALWCAEQALVLIGDPDPCSIKALEVKRAWLDGKATDEELAAARDAAAAAAWAAAAAAWAAAAAARDAVQDAQIGQLISMVALYEVA